MELGAPSGPVYQAGTLSGSPPAMAAGCAVLDALRDGAAYERLEDVGHLLETALSGAFDDSGIAGTVNRVGSMVTPFVGVSDVRDLAGARRADLAAFAQVHRAWLDAGVLWPPSQFEAGFLCTEHTNADVDRTATAFAGALTRLSASLPDRVPSR